MTLFCYPSSTNSIASLLICCLISLSTVCNANPETKDKGWEVDFFDDFDSFNHDNWQDQLLWVNGEDQCYVREGLHGTREVSKGTLKLRVIDLGEASTCYNWTKHGIQHPPTQYVAGRIASKNRKEFVRGRWTARLRVVDSGQPGMFPAWWLLGKFNNEPPIEEPDETICWPLTGSGEIDIFEHHWHGGPDHYAVRAIKSLGYCGGGDWQQKMAVMEATLNEFHEYTVEWSENGEDLHFILDGKTFYIGRGEGEKLSEPMFAILNFAKIDPNPMTTRQWEMEVDWVRHAKRIQAD